MEQGKLALGFPRRHDVVVVAVRLGIISHGTALCRWPERSADAPHCGCHCGQAQYFGRAVHASSSSFVDTLTSVIKDVRFFLLYMILTFFSFATAFFIVSIYNRHRYHGMEGVPPTSLRTPPDSFNG